MLFTILATFRDDLRILPVRMLPILQEDRTTSSSYEPEVAFSSTVLDRSGLHTMTESTILSLAWFPSTSPRTCWRRISRPYHTKSWTGPCAFLHTFHRGVSFVFRRTHRIPYEMRSRLDTHAISFLDDSWKSNVQSPNEETTQAFHHSLRPWSSWRAEMESVRS